MRNPTVRSLAAIASISALLGATASADVNVSSANLGAHFDAGDINNDGGATDPGHGGTVSAWTDLVTSTTLNHDTSGGTPEFVSAGNGGINNLATVRLTDESPKGDILYNNSMDVPAQTVFAVLTMEDSGIAYSTLLSGGGHSPNIRQGNNVPEYFAGNSGDFVQDGTNGTFYINGSAGRAVTYGQAHILEVVRNSPTTFAGLRIGDNVVNPGRRWEGDVAEIVIYDGALSADDRNRVGTYLAGKYNISTSYAPGTEFNGGDLLAAGNWSNGLPVSPVSGTSAVDGAFDDGNAGVADWRLTVTAGTITAGQDWRFTGASSIVIAGGILNVTGDIAVEDTSAITFSGGSIRASAFDFGSPTGSASLGGSAVLDGVAGTFGVLDIETGWTGSFTLTSLAGTDWENEFVAGNITLAGAVLDAAGFTANFTVSNGGRTLAYTPSNVFLGGDLLDGNDWSIGLPSVGTVSTVAVDGSIGGSVTGFGAGTTVNMIAGTLTSDGSHGFNTVGGGTWNISGGRIVTKYFLPNSDGGTSVANLSGGTIELAELSGDQFIAVGNGGVLNISGTAVLDATHASADLPTTGNYNGTIDIKSDWTGTWTWGTHAGDDWKNLFLGGTIKLDGSVLDAAGFDACFEVSNGGATLAFLTDSPVARFPSPANGVAGVPVDTDLAWSAPTVYEPAGYVVYFGTDPDVRANPSTAVATNVFDPPGGLEWLTTYHWVVDSLDGTTTHPGTPWSFTTGADPDAPYDPLHELALHNVTWTSPSSDSAGSMPIGNGDLGMNVWAEANGDLLLLLSKTDAWSDNGRLLKLGRVRIGMDPNPFASGQPFVQTLNLPNGEILVTAGSGSDEVQFRIWADANHPAIYVEADGADPRDWQADVELWRTAPRTLSGGEAESAYGARNGPTALVIEPDTVVSGPADRLVWYHRNVHSIYPDTLAVQALYQGSPAPPDPLLGRTFGASLAAPGFSSATGTRLSSDAPRADALFTIVAHTGVTPSAAAWQAALDAGVAALEAVPFAQRHTDHVAWWNAFWERHWMAVTETGSGVVPGSDAHAVTQGYALQRFINACGGRGGSPIKFNGSIFTVDATSAYDADYRRWGPCYWWQNTRLPYWTMPMAGDFDLMEPLWQMYLDALPLARERVQAYYGHPGAYFPETMYFWGTWNNDNYGWDRTGKEDGRSDNAYIRWEWQGGIELLWMMLTRYRIAPDEAFATGTLIPLAGDLVDLYDHRFPRDPDGTIRFTPAQALETYREGTENPTPEVAGLRRVLAGLLELPETLTTADRRAQWTRLLGELPPIPQRDRSGQQAISPAEVIGPKGNRESPELYSVFPYELHHVGKPDLALADWTYQTRADSNPNGWGQDAIFAAMLGRTAEAKSEVTRRFRTKHSGSRFPAIWGPNYDWIPDQDHGGATMIALQKMLLMEDDNRILLFPGWPADWDLRFKLHASGGTVIEGRLEAGEITGFRISPVERFGDVETFLGTLPPQAGGWEHWRLNTPGAGGGVHDNGDMDAFEDLLEYALGGDPADPATPEGPVIEPNGSGFTVRYDRPVGLPDVSYTLETSRNPEPDDWAPEPLTPSVIPLGAGRERVSYDFNAAGDRQFHRLRVNLLPQS